ncbi:MAG: LAGLIDADG family homing endonuclease [Candidatus Aenigmatarchaeota archaeon]
MYSEMLNWPQSQQMKYIRGFADGEGTPIMRRGCKKKNGKEYPQWDRKIKISNSDKKLLLTVQKMLEKAGVESRIYLDHAAGTGRATMDCWALLVLGKSNMTKFGSLVGFTESRKAILIRKILDSYR